MRFIVTAIIGFSLFFTAVVSAQNCCAPTVPQQGVLGETVALPHTLEIGLHYEYLRSRRMYEGSKEVDNPGNTKTDWKRATLTAAYGIVPGFSISTIIPYTGKKKTKDIVTTRWHIENSAAGIGDISLFLRFSPLSRSFVTFRELSFSLGVKLPTGAIDRRDFGFLLSQELQPGTGSWDYQGLLSFYQGFELADLVLSGTYVLTTPHDGYEFSNQFSYLLAANFHLAEYLDMSAALSGMVRGRDRQDGAEVHSTGRHQIWFVPGFKVQVIPEVLGFQAYYEKPVYQHFHGTQLGSDYNIRLTIAYLLPLTKTTEDDS
ncbi:MAG: hypothetical protein KAT58_00825 [candidate division Zixibacteria bacterium]|nr:hypothetical protein [candidate division Zixibacteria bacterium]